MLSTEMFLWFSGSTELGRLTQHEYRGKPKLFNLPCDLKGEWRLLYSHYLWTPSRCPVFNMIDFTVRITLRCMLETNSCAAGLFHCKLLTVMEYWRTTSGVKTRSRLKVSDYFPILYSCTTQVFFKRTKAHKSKSTEEWDSLPSQYEFLELKI